jgi:DNA invertase Pin-like site-specific DNA recombinase
VQPPFSIFKTRDDGSLQFVEGADSLESAKERVEELAKFWPGEYVIMNQQTGERRALETFRAQGIEFVSFSEQLDTSTPAGKMVFTILGAVAELERGLIVERVKAGLRNARSKGKRLGRPPKTLDRAKIAALRAQGLGWKRIAVELGVGVGTIYQASRSDAPLLDGSKTREKVF